MKISPAFQLAVSFLLSFALAACSESPAEPVTPAAGTPSPAPTTAAPAAPATGDKPASLLADAQQMATDALSGLGQKLLASTPGGNADELLKKISTDLGEQVAALGGTLASDAPLTEKLQTAVEALLENKDIAAIESLDKLTAAKLTPEQTQLAKQVYDAGAAFVTQRNFAAIEGLHSDVAQLANAVWKGQYTEALPPLQKLYSQSTLTPQQKDLLGATFDRFMPAGWKESAGKLQQGLDALKGFGK